MPTLAKRINTVLEPPLYREVERLARGDRVSLSQKVRDLVREALELEEDQGWEKLVSGRKERKSRWLTHAEVWTRSKR